MSIVSEDGKSRPSPLECGEILFRLLKRSWIHPDGNGILPDAFRRRPVDNGLSVFIASLCSIEEARTKLEKVRGVASLHTGRVRDIGLDVTPDPGDIQHAEIVGVPLADDDEHMANYFADLLAEQARLAWA